MSKNLPRNSGVGGRANRRAFTIIEGAIVIIIIAMLAGILLLALAGARRSARASAERQFAASAKSAVAQFKEQFGILPPLVDDADPFYTSGASGTLRVRIAGVDPNQADVTQETKFLSFDASTNATARRYSELSMPFYLLGVLGKDVDGVDGFGYTGLGRDGQFTRKGKVNPSLLSIEKDATRLGAPADGDARYPIRPLAQEQHSQDRLWDGFTRNRLNQVAIRYYRWLPTFYTKSDAPTPADAGKVKSTNVPAIVGDVSKRPELRDAEFAIVGAGQDRLFGDEVGLSPAEADKAREDNIVEVGR